MMSDQNSLTHDPSCMTVSLHLIALRDNPVKPVTRVGTLCTLWEWMQPEW